jgi:hypothetical protein
VADGGGAQPESTRERGLPVARGGGPGAESGGEAQALERRGRSGVGSERLGGSLAEGKEMGEKGGSHAAARARCS